MRRTPVGCGSAVHGAHAPESPLLHSRLYALLVLTTLAALALAAVPATAANAAGAPPAAAAAAPVAAPAATTANDANAKLLTGYLDNLRTLRTTFLQTLADANGREIDRESGTLIVSRPGKFSWAIHPQATGSASKAGSGGGQLMVCDGVNLWFYDRDLQQVTVKPVDAALSATPAMLLSGTVDVRKNFSISGAGQRMGLDWVLVEPNGADADFREALFGFSHGDLKRMILEDKLDQTATIIFDKVERNGAVSPGEVSFTPPAGADVIGTPRH
jgi:outer membrane lipoprotein carrier protein